MIKYAWHNGDWVRNDAPLFQAQDRLRLGDGVFDTLLIIDGKPLHYAQHFSRLKHDASVMGLTMPIFDDAHAALIPDLLAKNSLDTGRYALNTIISRGAGQRGLMPSANATSSASLILSPVPDTFPNIHAITCTQTRRNEHSPLSQIKSCNYGDNIIALNEADKRGANEALLMNTAGHIVCSSSGNIFIALNDEIITPPLSEGAMNGVTRGLLIDALPVREATITLDMIHNAHAIYICNSIRGVMRLSQLDETYYDTHTPHCALDLADETGRILGLA